MGGQLSKVSEMSAQPIDDTIEDSLEFYIKFPASNGPMAMQESAYSYATTTDVMTSVRDEGKSSDVDNNEIELVFDERENTPIVLLLGWAGCQDKYLQKYSKIYEDRG